MKKKRDVKWWTEEEVKVLKQSLQLHNNNMQEAAKTAARILNRTISSCFNKIRHMESEKIRKSIIEPAYTKIEMPASYNEDEVRLIADAYYSFPTVKEAAEYVSSLLDNRTQTAITTKIYQFKKAIEKGTDIPFKEVFKEVIKAKWDEEQVKLAEKALDKYNDSKKIFESKEVLTDMLTDVAVDAYKQGLGEQEKKPMHDKSAFGEMEYEISIPEPMHVKIEIPENTKSISIIKGLSTFTIDF